MVGVGLGFVRSGGGGTGGVVLPSALGGLGLWCRASDLALANNDPVTTWTKSGGTLDSPTQAVAGAKPTFKTAVLNGKAVVEFDGGDMLDVTAFAPGAFTLFAVFRATVHGLLFEHGANIGAETGFALYTGIADSVAVFYGANRSHYNVEASWGLGNVWRIVEWVHDGTHAGHRVMVAGATPVGWSSHATFTLDPGTSGPSKVLHVGARAGPTAGVTGQIAEFALYHTTKHSNADRQGVLNYLADYYALPIL